MKKAILLIAFILTVVSCKKETKASLPKSLVAKQALAQKLKKTIDSLSLQLKEVENQISKETATEAHFNTVTTVKATKKDFAHHITLNGVVKSDKSIDMRPELGGTVKAIYVKTGQWVNRGKVLMQLDDAIIQNSIAELNVQLALAQTTYERQERLWKQKIGSEMQYLSAKTQKEALDSKLKTLYSQARKSKIVAPFSGTVDAVFPKVGEMTSNQFPVIRLVNLTSVYLEADISENYLKDIKKGSEVAVHFPSLDKTMITKISTVANYIDPKSRSFVARIAIANKDKSIKPNLLADLKITDFKANGVVIPIDLIQTDNTGKDFVFVAVKTTEGKAKIQKKIITIIKDANSESLVEGLAEGDFLVQEGAKLVSADEEVLLKE